ncbi:MAG: DNA replication and repair protein RecF [Candidatus Levybacteria bacterium]|nr:DNA replication and repair protein RecF [Candidatus Levybacteria bacterium]MBP9815181.1 DNA replication and repair protein RecF [Candidatus Levybacteria bacterium]
MIVTKITLKQFRSHHKKTFEFGPTTIIIGRNTAGKSNILEALYVLSHGTSFRAARDADMIENGYEFARIEGLVKDGTDTTNLVTILALQNNYLSKKYLVNDVPRALRTFSDYLYTVLFTPQDIEIVTASPGGRRRYIDSILSNSHKEYRAALSRYEKALRQRNRMLSDMKNGRKTYQQVDFEFWEKLLIEHGTTIHEYRRGFVEYVNGSQKQIFDFEMHYDHSIISVERLFKYRFEERASGVTLVGPQRDDFQFFYANTRHEVKEYGSRGEQRLTVLQLKLLEIEYLKARTGAIPVLLLDDIFSELDNENIDKIYHFLEGQQTIITTTHKEFVPEKILKQGDLKIIEL